MDQPTNLHALGLALQQLREAHDMTPEELAHRAGLDPAHIATLERGGADPALFGDLNQIAEALGEPLSEVIYLFERRSKGGTQSNGRH